MDHFAILSPAERAIYFEQTAVRRNLSPWIIEKDFWVCWMLGTLFSLPELGGNLTFKGGTSLSKVYGLIERFSEDIDVSIEREFLGFQDENPPETAMSNKEKKRRLEALSATCSDFIRTRLLPALQQSIASRLTEAWSLEIDPADPDSQTILFQYPQALRSGTSDYIRPTVKIELGAKSDHWPTENGKVISYVAEEIPQIFQEASASLRVLSARRTFWEKATILHAEYHREASALLPSRLSRHYYDIYRLIEAGIGTEAANDPALLVKVAQHKSVFFRSAWANYETAKKGTLKLVPSDHRLPELERDYQAMQEMFFTTPPAFSEIVATIAAFERDFS